MKLLSLLFILFWSGFLTLFEQELPTIKQNMPVKVGTPVTFKIENYTRQVPNIAWDFGDGNGLGPFKKGLTMAHVYTNPGVYYIFARIEGEEIPLSVIQTIVKPTQNPGPTHASTIKYDSVLRKIWVINQDNNSISKIDAKSLELEQEITVGKKPRTADLDKKGNVWVANEDDATISIITPDGKLSNTIALPYASRPYGICFDPQKLNAFVTLQATGRLIKLDAITRKIIGDLAVGRTPRGIAVSSNGQSVLVTQYISPQEYGIVREVISKSMTVKKEIKLPFDETPDFEDRGRGVPNFVSSVVITPDGSEAWVTSKKDNVARGKFRDGNELTFDNTVRTIVSKINLSTGTEILSSRKDFNDSDLACMTEFSPYGNMAFVATQGNNSIHLLEVGTNARLGSLDTTGLAPQGLAFNADGSRLFVHNFMSRTVRVYNTEAMILSNNFDPVIVKTISTVTKELLDEQVLKGKQIFYNSADERMSFASYLSCATCHNDGGSDERVWDFTDRGEGFRNTQVLLGRRGTGMGNVHWTGNFDEIQDFENDIRNSFGGKGFMDDNTFNSKTVSDPLGTPKKGLSIDLDALAAYVHSLDKVHPSPYRQQDGSLTKEAIQGKQIFIKADCGVCHKGPDFTDRPTGVFHNVGTIQPSSGKRRNEELLGFATPTLKGVFETAPYLHDGSAPSLHDVLVAKNKNGKHGKVSELSDAELNQLISYLMQIDENEKADATQAVNEENSTFGSFDIYPNPASELLHVKVNSQQAGSFTITIYNAKGQQVYTGISEFQNELDISLHQFPPGEYIVSYSRGLWKSNRKLIVK